MALSFTAKGIVLSLLVSSILVLAWVWTRMVTIPIMALYISNLVQPSQTKNSLLSLWKFSGSRMSWIGTSNSSNGTAFAVNIIAQMTSRSVVLVPKVLRCKNKLDTLESLSIDDGIASA
jgi:hypothetical protein